MSGKNKKKMAKKKFRTWADTMPTVGEVNTEPSKTMPDMHNDPRTIIENHVRGINPITGAILDGQKYYGDAILPYAKDLTYEELRIQREALKVRSDQLREQMQTQIDEQNSANQKTMEGNSTEGSSTTE